MELPRSAPPAGDRLRIVPPALYAELTPWYHLVDPPADHADEVACFLEAFAAGIVGPSATLLELGSGAGHNACHLKARFACTLSDISEPMLALSRARNPECEHVAGDMRTLRLGRTFDAVLAHDGITYMTTEADLSAAIETAFVHTRPGGAAIFTPDDVADTFVAGAELHESDDGERSLRYLEWSWDPVPGDGKVRVEYALLMREAGEVRSFHDRHETGLFPRATWIRLLEDAGFVVDSVRRPIGDGATDEIFVGRRPMADER
jgi:SAM-dependent methyltransferase